MKIIKKGIIPVENYQGTCSYCGTIIECDKEDITFHGDQRDPYSGVYCPICRMTVIYLDEKKVRDYQDDAFKSE